MSEITFLDWILAICGLWFSGISIACAYFVSRGWRVRVSKATEARVANNKRFKANRVRVVSAFAVSGNLGGRSAYVIRQYQETIEKAGVGVHNSNSVPAYNNFSSRTEPTSIGGYRSLTESLNFNSVGC